MPRLNVSEIYVVIPTAPPSFFGRSFENMAASLAPCASSSADLGTDIDEYVAVTFILNYLEITEEMLAQAAKHALASGNKPFHIMMTNGLISYRAVDDALEEKKRALGSKLPSAIRTCVANAKQWIVSNDRRTIDTGRGPPLQVKRQASKAALKCMERYWFLLHRKCIHKNVLKGCRAAAKQAPLAPDTYYTVTRLMRKTKIRERLKQSVAYALHGRGRPGAFDFSLV